MKNASIFKWLSVMLAVFIIAAAIGCGQGEPIAIPPAPTPTPTATATAEPAGLSGTLSDIEGDVQVLRSGASSWSAATNGMKIWTGDGLKTGSNGYALATFFDGSVMEIEADTEISVEELSQASGGSTTVRIHQTVGNTLNRVQNLVDSSSTYEIETKAGTAVVRGTIFNVQVRQYGGSAHTCVNTVDEEDNEDHSVDFSNSGKTVNIPEGMKSCGWEGGVPCDPFYTDPTDDPLFHIGDGGGGGSSCIPCQECGDCPQGMWCNNGCCQVTSTPTPEPTPNGNGCLENGASCTENAECCSGWCDDGFCAEE